MRYCIPQILQIYAELFSENLRDLREIRPGNRIGGNKRISL